MKVPYNLIQVKQHLPEVLEWIRIDKEIAKDSLWLYQILVQQCIYETTHPEADFGVQTTEEFMRKTWNDYKENLAEAKHLQSLVDKVKDDLVAIES